MAWRFMGFYFWGAIHGLLVCVERLLGWRKDSDNYSLKFVRILFTFMIVMFAWLPFRAEGVGQLSHFSNQILVFNFSDLYLAFAENIFTPGMFGVLVLFGSDLFFGKKGILKLNQFNWIARYFWVAVLFMLICFIGDVQSTEFLYFQF